MSENLLPTRWLSLTAALGLPPGRTEETYRELIKAYGGPGRYYHNLEHLESVLAVIERLEDEARHPNLVQLSGWFHDAI
jgi:predicted metal-dependent HD superfamily phosphohydrolase